MSIKPILPGARIGVLGSGQLGRMLALAARKHKYPPFPMDNSRNRRRITPAPLRARAPSHLSRQLVQTNYARPAWRAHVHYQQVPFH